MGRRFEVGGDVGPPSPEPIWTADKVKAELCEAYRLAQKTGRTEHWERVRRLTQVEPQARRDLVTWACHVTGWGDTSLRQLCANRGVDRATFDRRVCAAANLAADELNRLQAVQDSSHTIVNLGVT